MTRRTSFLFVALAFAWQAFGRDEYTRTFDRTVDLRSGQRVSIEHKLGDLTIHTHPEARVVIHADIRVSASAANQAKQFADHLEILVEPSAPELSIRTRYPEMVSSRNISYSVHYDITIPETAPLQVRNSFGGVSVTGLKANADITTSHGGIEFRDGRGAQRLEDSFAGIKVNNNAGDVTIEGSNGPVDVSDIAGAATVRDRFASVTADRVTKGVRVVNSNGTVNVTDSGGSGNIRNSFGGVTVHSFRGDLIVNNGNGRVEATNVQGPVSIATSFGSVTASDIQGAVRVESSNGSISVAKTHGECNVKTSFGTVHAEDIGGILSVENSNGAVKASNTQGAQVRTSFGAVILDGVLGAIRVENQNGAVDATSSLHGSCQPILIRTSFSTLRVRVSPDASYRVLARTSFGKIRTDFPLNVSGSISDDELNGTIGGGRCEMRLTNSNGAIEILKP